MHEPCFLLCNKLSTGKGINTPRTVIYRIATNFSALPKKAPDWCGAVDAAAATSD